MLVDQQKLYAQTATREKSNWEEMRVVEVEIQVW